jgi:hypothetical protein
MPQDCDFLHSWLNGNAIGKVLRRAGLARGVPQPQRADAPRTGSHIVIQRRYDGDGDKAVASSIVPKGLGLPRNEALRPSNPALS